MIILTGYLTAGCSNATIDTFDFQPAKSTAYFDYFSYSGNDDFYNNNILPGKSYFYNPILPGWYSDPSICTNGEDYFLVTSSFSYFPGVPIFHSRDLVNWKQIGHVLDRTSQLPLDSQRVSEGIFAPAISYNPGNQTYYMITTNIRRGNFFVKTKDPFGDWSEPIWLPDVHGIDPSFFFDDDGKTYIVNNDEPDGGSQYDGHRAIRVLEFDIENEKTIGESKMLINGGVDLTEKPIWIEGPHLYKIEGKYYLMCAEGGTSVNHREVIFSGDSPMGEFIPWEKNPILTQKHLDPERELPVTCAGHADLIKTKEGDWWAIFLACRPIDNQFENLGRETFLLPVKWSDDGFPFLTKENEVVPRIVSREGIERGSEVTFGNFEKVVNFDSSALGLDWMTLRSPIKDYYSLAENPGYLTLKCPEVNTVDLMPSAYVSRRIQHHQFEATTRLIFEPEDDLETAGVLLLKDEGHQYYLSVSQSQDGKKVSLEKVTPSGVDVLASNKLENGQGPLLLKVISKGKTFDFLYAENEENWNTLLEDVDAHYLSTANSFGFTGTMIGMYASKKPFK